MSEVSYDLSTVRRTVGDTVLEAGEAKILTISQVYDTDVEDLWAACTTAERIPRWLMPIEGELKVGGHYQLVGNAHGTVERCDPPRSFAATWEFGGEVSWVEVRFTAEDDKARLTLEHTALVSAERWQQYGPGAVGIGWDMMLTGLAQHIRLGGATLDPEAFMAWAASPDGVRFMTEASELWRAASVESGTPDAEATAAAERVLGFYTGTG